MDIERMSKSLLLQLSREKIAENRELKEKVKTLDKELKLAKGAESQAKIKMTEIRLTAEAGITVLFPEINFISTMEQMQQPTEPNGTLELLRKIASNCYLPKPCNERGRGLGLY